MCVYDGDVIWTAQRITSPHFDTVWRSLFPRLFCKLCQRKTQVSIVSRVASLKLCSSDNIKKNLLELGTMITLKNVRERTTMFIKFTPTFGNWAETGWTTHLTYNESRKIVTKLQWALILSCIMSAQKSGRIPRHVYIRAQIGFLANWTVFGERNYSNDLDSAAGCLSLELGTTIIFFVVASLASDNVALAWPTARNCDVFDPKITKALIVAWTALDCFTCIFQGELAFHLLLYASSTDYWKPSFAVIFFSAAQGTACINQWQTLGGYVCLSKFPWHRVLVPRETGQSRSLLFCNVGQGRT